MTIALRQRRSLLGVVLASTMCSGLLSGSASATDTAPARRPAADVTAHRMLLDHAAATGARLAEPTPGSSGTDHGAMVLPVEGRLTSTYGPRHGRMHKGIDLAAPVGTPIRAVQDGTVAFAGWKGGYGNTVDITHDGSHRTRSAHQSELLVRTGDTVERGQVIGRVGTTGSSTGPHLHFEVSVAQAHIDPADVLPDVAG